MDAQGKHHSPLTPQQTWDALNSTPLLRRCLPGCESLQRGPDGRLELIQVLRVAETSARFTVAIELEDVDPPHSYVLRFEGQAGGAGYGVGRALVALQPDAGGTLIQYQLVVESGGALSHFGADALQQAVQALIAVFFLRFDRLASGQSLEPPSRLRRWWLRLRPPLVALSAVAVVLALYLRLHGFW